jgi:hypothetical protein
MLVRIKYEIYEKLTYKQIIEKMINRLNELIYDSDMNAHVFEIRRIEQELDRTIKELDYKIEKLIFEGNYYGLQ